VAEQSHKQEMSDAVRGDFERLRARRQRDKGGAERAPADRPERIVLTPPQPAVEEPAPEAEEQVAPLEAQGSTAREPQESEARRSRLRSLLRRG
jgi:hypothetical protein